MAGCSPCWLVWSHWFYSAYMLCGVLNQIRNREDAAYKSHSRVCVCERERARARERENILLPEPGCMCLCLLCTWISHQFVLYPSSFFLPEGLWNLKCFQGLCFSHLPMTTVIHWPPGDVISNYKPVSKLTFSYSPGLAAPPWSSGGILSPGFCANPLSSQKD